MITRYHVYVAGPLTKGGQIENVRLAIAAGERLRRAGLIPFVPHLGVFCDLAAPGPTYEDWMTWCLAWLAKCDAVLRLPGESSGADREVVEATRLGLPVFTDVADVRGWAVQRALQRAG